MMMGMGDGTTGTVATASPGFTDGLTLWGTPSAAISAVQGVFTNASTAFSGTQLPYTAGVLAPPALLLIALLGMGGGGGGGRY
jgi:hypothetical protein